MRQGLLEQAERDRHLGLENDIVGNSRLLAAKLVLGPFLRQVEAIAARQAGVMIGERKRHRGLAVGPLAKLPAILPRDPDRMPALLGKARVVEDPRLDRTVPLHRRQDIGAHLGQHGCVRPLRLPHEMQQ